MKVMVIVKASKASEAGEMPNEQLLTAMGNYNEELVKAGIMQAGEGLHPSSKGVRVNFDGVKSRTVTDGPFPETKELIAGFWIWQVKSLTEAVEWAKRCPNPHEEAGHLEIRPIFSAEDFGAEFTPALREQEADLRAQTLGLGQVRFEDRGELTVVGLSGTYAAATRHNIPQQWERFAKQQDKQLGHLGVSYGVVGPSKTGGDFDYLTGVEARAGETAPGGSTRLTLPPRRYAVFTHAGDVTTIDQTCDAIWEKWAPDAGLKIAKAPWFERYGEGFDPETMQGDITIWIPLET